MLGDNVSIHARFAFSFAICLAVAGCQTPQPLAYLDLESSSQLQPNRQKNADRIPYQYTGAVVWADYRQAIIEPVVIYRGRDNQFGNMSEKDKQLLAHYAQTEFTKSLGRRFAIVTWPGPQTIRVRVTLAGAKTGTPVVGAVTKVDLLGGPYNAIQAVRGKEGMLSGTINYAIEIFDAPTNRLLAAYVAKQYPSAINLGTGWTPLDASKVGIRKGADELLQRMR